MKAKDYSKKCLAIKLNKSKLINKKNKLKKT